MAEIPAVAALERRPQPQIQSVSHGPSLGWLVLLWCFGGLIVGGLGMALNDVISLDRDREAFEQKVAAAEKHIQVLLAQIQQREDDLVTSTQRNSQLQADIQELGQKKLELTGAVTKESATLDLKKKELAQVEQSVRTGLAERSKIDTEIESLRVQSDALTKVRDALTSKVSELEGEKKTLEESVNNLKTTQATLLKDLQASNDELDKAKTALGDIENQTRVAKKNRTDAENALIPLAMEEARINALLKKHAELSNNNAELAKSLELLEAQVADANKAEISSRNDLAKLKTDIDTAENDRIQTLAKKAQLLAEVKVLEVNKAQLEADLTNSETQKSKIDAAVKAAEDMKLQLETNITKLQAAEGVLNKSVSSLNSQNDGLQIEIKQKQTEASNLQDQVNLRRSDLTSLLRTIEQSLPKKDASPTNPKSEPPPAGQPADQPTAKDDSKTGTSP